MSEPKKVMDENVMVEQPPLKFVHVMFSCMQLSIIEYSVC